MGSFVGTGSGQPSSDHGMGGGMRGNVGSGSGFGHGDMLAGGSDFGGSMRAGSFSGEMPNGSGAPSSVEGSA